jgi:hypothetical protein
MSAQPEPDRAQIERFVNALFAHAGEGGYVSLRAFYDDKKSGVFDIRPVLLNGGGLGPVIDAAADLAKDALWPSRAIVVCPPIASFRGNKADEANLLEAYALSVECDSAPNAARATLSAILSRPTLAVASGGEWADPDTGEVQPKLHLHWRLAEVAQTPEEHARLKRARALACELVGADPSNNTAVHPIRWPGTAHRKNLDERRLCRIVEENAETEIALEDALERLEQAAGVRQQYAQASTEPAAPKAEGNLSGFDFNIRPNGGGMGRELLMRAAELIPNQDCDWHHWNTVGMAFWAETGGSADGLAAFDAWSRKSGKHDPAETAKGCAPRRGVGGRARSLRRSAARGRWPEAAIVGLR